MENWKEKIQGYLPAIEEFLTSLLLEETTIHPSDAESSVSDKLLEELGKNDVFICAREENSGMDVIIYLDEEWYGLLSSIMLGVEEKKFNEITSDLIRKFSEDLIQAVKPALSEHGLEVALTAMEVVTKSQLRQQLHHTEYDQIRLEVEGLADDNVKAGILFGNPEALIQPEEPVPEEAPQPAETTEELSSEGEPEAEQDDPEQIEEEEGEYLDQVISAKHVEFDEFKDEESFYSNGNGDARSMELLKDVEMDVSVELGRIELPLGKVLQLAKGSVIELEKLAGEPVDILVNGLCIAKGEVVVIDEHFGVRISSLVSTRQRMAGIS